MSWSGSSPLAVVRDGMWGLLMFAGVAWLAIAWSVLRLEPGDVVHVAGPVILFGALAEALRACAGARTWWINAGMAVLFAVTGVVLLAEADTSYTTPAALVGWYLMVRGAVDVAVAMMTRSTDRIWGLLMVVGVLETALGFFAASPYARTADLVVVVLGGLGVLRAVADLTTGLRLREMRAPRADVLELSPERAAGVAGYSAGLSDFDLQPSRGRPRHRAVPRVSPAVGAARTDGEARADGGVMWPAGPPVAAESVAGGGTAADVAAGGVSATGGMAAAGYVAASGVAPAGGSFHDEVLRTTADLDAMLAMAGVTGAGVAVPLPAYDGPQVPDTAEGAEVPDGPAAGRATADPAMTDRAETNGVGTDRAAADPAMADPAMADRPVAGSSAQAGATAVAQDASVAGGGRRSD